jgi:glycosyltransferase involved in cell wall biosynthesis
MSTTCRGTERNEGAAVRRTPLPAGVSIVICCHNSAQRLEPTLAHLVAQQVKDGIPWEVILIDNASTDNTAEFARACWSLTTVPLHIISEPRLGLIYARERGFSEANYEFISFIDDDNWVCPEWVNTIFELMREHAEIGICGGINEAVCEVSSPWWFDEFKNMFAVSPKNVEIGCLGSGEVLPGAGMTVRSSAWRSVMATGYRWFVVGRKGEMLTACDDWEICLAIRLAGWQLWRDPRLRLKHFLPAGRLNWAYVRRLHRGHGVSSVQLDGYYFLSSEQLPGWKRSLRKMWQWHMLACVVALLKHPVYLLTFWRPFEGNREILNLEVQLGRAIGFIRSHKNYADDRRRVRELVQASPEVSRT